MMLTLGANPGTWDVPLIWKHKCCLSSGEWLFKPIMHILTQLTLILGKNLLQRISPGQIHNSNILWMEKWVEWWELALLATPSFLVILPHLIRKISASHHRLIFPVIIVKENWPFFFKHLIQQF